MAGTDPTDKLRELADAWERAAWENRIYPLDEGSSYKYLVRPERSEVYGEPVYDDLRRSVADDIRPVDVDVGTALVIRKIHVAVDDGDPAIDSRGELPRAGIRA